MNQLPRDIRRKLHSRSAEINPRFKQDLKRSLFKENIMAGQTTSPLKNFLIYVRTTPALAVATTLLIVGTSSLLIATDRANVARDTEIEVPKNLEGLKSLDEIRALALADMPDSKIVGVELEKEEGAQVYKVKFDDDSIRLYNAKTGDAIDKETTEKDGTVPADFVAGVSLQEARSIAQAQRPGKTITKIELETEQGVVIYSVRFSDGGRVGINANDGSVLRLRDGRASSSSSSNDDSSDKVSDDKSSDD